MANPSFEIVMQIDWVDPPDVGGILDFFDASVADGTLQGAGLRRWARLAALRRMILASGELFEEGLIEEACFALQDVYDQCHKENTDFVRGPATVELSKMILDLVVGLGFDKR